MNSGLAWIDSLGGEMAGQRELLRGLMRMCAADDRLRWLVVGCSVARGAGDRLSDLDLGLGVADLHLDTALPEIRSAVDGLGDLVESFAHQLPGLTIRHERIFAQYADRCQVDLVVFPASAADDMQAGAVILYDPDNVVRLRPGRHRAAPEQVREWAFHGWCALADAGKYLRRGSPWEALERLHEARTRVFQLQAAAHEVPDPQYGIVSILDFAPAAVPAGIEATVTGLDPGRLLAAARRLAGLLARAGEQLPPGHRAALPGAMAGFVTRDLQQIT